jgi:hypothetical protein
MISLQERLATILSLATQLRELDQLHERVRKAELVRRLRGLPQKKNAPLAKRPAASPYCMRPWPPGMKRSSRAARAGKPASL